MASLKYSVDSSSPSFRVGRDFGRLATRHLAAVDLGSGACHEFVTIDDYIALVSHARGSGLRDNNMDRM